MAHAGRGTAVKGSRWRQGRRIVQALSFLLFLVSIAITVRVTGESRRILSPDALFRLDPLAAVAAMLAARRWMVRLAPALGFVGVTLILGRFWCGWLCPLGTLIDWFSPRRALRKEPPSSRWRSIKYGLLFLILSAAVLGNLTLMILDPLTIFLRSVGMVVLPALTWLVTRAEIALYRAVFLRGVLGSIDRTLRGVVLSYQQPYYGSGLLLAGLLAGVLSLSLLARRGWCRYLCPLGALLGLLAKASWLKRKVSPACVNCGACERECLMGTVDVSDNYVSDSGECILCMSCAAACPVDAVSFARDWSVDWGQDYNPSRRHLVSMLGAAVGGWALLKTSPRAHHPDPHRLRPPGAEERTLLSSCIRCGACIRVCPTHGLQLSLTESGLEGLWTPILVPRLGSCDYSCTACGEICPTGAIPPLALERKQQTPIGKAYIDQRICIPWSGRGECIVCEEMCPLPEKAIVLEDRPTTDQSGAVRILQSPVMRHDQCIGCGLCEQKCPVNGEAAIRVVVDPMA